MQNVVRPISIVLLYLGLIAGAATLSAPAFCQDAKPEAKAAEKKEGEEQKGPAGPFDNINPIVPLLVIMVLFFFFIILPAQRRQKREQESILANLKKNDEVVTAAGIIGIVSLIKDNEDEVTLKIDDNARIKVLKSSIVRIKNKEEPKAGATPPAADTNIKPTT